MRNLIIAVAMVGVLALMGCGQDEFSTGGVPTSRVIDRQEWISKVLLGGEEQDTLLSYSGPMVADTRGVFIADMFSGRIVHVSPEGALRWTVGRRGQGPEEFGRVVDLKLDATGNLWVVDIDNARLSVLDDQGHFLERMSLAHLPGRVMAVLPLLDQPWVLLQFGEVPLLRIGRDGAVVDSRPLPWDSAASVPQLAGSLTTAANVYDDVLYMGYQLGNGILAFQGDGSQGNRKSFIEPIPFPQVIQTRSGNSVTTEFEGRPEFAARALSFWGDKVYVHFAGLSEDRLSIVDVYDANDLQYEGSFVLPRRVNTAVVVGDRVYAEFSDPFPTLVEFTRAKR